jgi:ribosome-binding factor A
MEAVQTTRQQKISRQIQRDIAEILQKECRGIGAGAMITVTTVRVSPDFAYAKIYFSIFPFDRNAAVMEELEKNNWLIRRELGKRIRNQLKIVPELEWFIDDSLEYIENIDNLLK